MNRSSLVRYGSSFTFGRAPTLLVNVINLRRLGPGPTTHSGLSSVVGRCCLGVDALSCGPSALLCWSADDNIADMKNDGDNRYNADAQLFVT